MRGPQPSDSPSPLATLLQRLESVRETGHGRWIARCPTHEDRSPSLSVRELEDGRILLHDFGGCAPGAVLAAVGLELRDLFPIERQAGWVFSPASRSKRRVPSRDLVLLGSQAALVVVAAAAILRRGETLTDDAFGQLSEAEAWLWRLREAAT